MFYSHLLHDLFFTLQNSFWLKKKSFCFCFFSHCFYCSEKLKQCLGWGGSFMRLWAFFFMWQDTDRLLCVCVDASKWLRAWSKRCNWPEVPAFWQSNTYSSSPGQHTFCKKHGGDRIEHISPSMLWRFFCRDCMSVAKYRRTLKKLCSPECSNMNRGQQFTL